VTAPRDMETHTLNVKAAWPAPHAVMHQAQLSDDVTIDPVYDGRCLHLHSDGTLKTGLPATQYLCRPPMWPVSASDDPDIELDGGDPSADVGVYGSINAPRRGSESAVGISCLVGLQTFEVETTEFQSEASLGASYAPGNALTATPADTNATTGGRITRCTGGIAGAEPVCGIVSHAVTQNAARHDILSLWTWFLPKLTA
jgi:hypothetical protein